MKQERFESTDLKQQEYETMDLRELFNLIKNHLVLIVATTLEFALIGFLITTFFMTPMYQANATMLVNTRQDATAVVTNDQINSAKNLVETYSIIIKSDTVLQQVIDRLGLDMTYEALNSKVTVTAVNNTQVMRIAVQDENPQNAKMIAEGIAEVAPDVIMDAVEAGSVKLVSAARVGTKPVSPNKAKNTVAATLLGLVCSTAFVLVSELLNNTMKSDEDLQKRLSLPVIGVIPLLQDADAKKKSFKDKILPKSKRKRHHSTRKIQLIGKQAPFNYVEAYKSLRTNLNFMAVSNDYKVVTITSAIPEEGKSNVAVNLAISIAESGKNVILLDCDLRKPVLHKYLNLSYKSSGKGLTSVLGGQCAPEDAIVAFDSLNFHLLPAGPIPPNPAELVGSQRMKDLLDKLANTYDYVILDTPPVSVVTDAAVMGAMADGTILVVRQNFATYETVSLAKRNLDSAHAHIIGTVMNYFEAKGTNRETGYSYSYNYNYYSQL